MLRQIVAIIVAVVASAAVASPARANGYPRGLVSGVADGTGLPYIFVVNNFSGEILFARSTGQGSFTRWLPVQGNGVAAGQNVAVVLNQQGRIMVFVRGTDNRIYYNTQTGLETFAGWSVIGSNTFTSDPSAARNAYGIVEVVAAYQNDVWSNWQVAPNSGFQGSWDFKGNTPMYPIASGNADLAITKTSGGLLITAGKRYRYQATPGYGFSSWAEINGKYPIDHVAVGIVGSSTYAVRLDYHDSDGVSAPVMASSFSTSTGTFTGTYRPGGGDPVAWRAPLGTGAFVGRAIVACVGADERTVYYTSQGAQGGATNTWVSLGVPPNTNTAYNATVLVAPAQNITYVLVNVATPISVVYYKVIGPQFQTSIWYGIPGSMTMS